MKDKIIEILKECATEAYKKGSLGRDLNWSTLNKFADRLSEAEVEEAVISAWPPRDVVEKLTIGADILLHKKDYDDHGWEELEYCYRIAKQWLQSYRPPPHLR